jgi:photosystem II stability/assembly factor-like uncharacterized protein
VKTKGFWGAINNISFADPNVGFAICKGHGLLKTTDAGQNWSLIMRDDGETFSDLAFTDSLTGYLVGTTILKTVDGGATWITQTGGITDMMMDVDFPANDIGYIVASHGRVLRTSDGGANWELTQLDTNLFLTSVHFYDPMNGVIADSYGSILISHNGGISWVNANFNPAGQYIYEITMVDATTGYLIGSNSMIAKTIDGGANWNTIIMWWYTGNLDMYFSDTATGFLVNYNGPVYNTVDGGATWEAMFTGTNEWLTTIDFTDANTGYIGGECGTIKKTTWGAIGIDNDRRNARGIKVYPNPAANMVTIEMLKTYERGYVTVYNNYGQEVLRYDINDRVTTLDVSCLGSGLYFIRIRLDNYELVEKFMKL